MNNVIRLFRQERTDDPPDSDAIVTSAVTDILASHAQLACTIKVLSKQLDALDHITDTVVDIDTRARSKEVAKRSRESLAKAMFDLSK